MKPPFFPHQVHDDAALIRRWERVAEQAGLEMVPIAPEGTLPEPVYRLRTPGPLDPKRSVYLSAGIHGDEPAGSEGLIAWAEANLDWFRTASCVIFPCLNPAGLRENTRRDGCGIDLNREFQSPTHPLIEAWRKEMGSASFHLALCLHEDFDANGIYVYELSHPDDGGTGTACLEACSTILPREPGAEVDGRPFEEGLLRHDEPIEDLMGEMSDGMPEAIYLKAHHARVSLTFETPSEFGLDLRVQAQAKCITAALRHLGLCG